MFLDVRDLTITLKTGEEIAEDISFSIDGGEMLSIVGSSGAGKTTVCKAVMGLLSSNYSISGEVLYRGENLLHCSKKRLQAIYGKEICYIMQNPMTAFNPSLRIGRQLEKTCYLHNPQISRQELQLLVSNTLQQLGLVDLKRILKSYPDALSGGMLQRIMIAAALINQPTILVADEATTAIDACNRIELMQLLRQLCSGGMAILFVTHDLRAASMADRILIMNDGQLVEAGTTEQIFNEPKEEYTKYLLSACTLERRGFVAVSPVSIQFIDGERYAIVGESGSGKTTLARMIAGLQRPTTGNIYVDGMPVYGKHKVHTNYFKEVQIIQQDSSSALDPKMSVGRSIEEPLLCFFHLDKGERKKRCHDLMDLCNLPVEYYSRLPAELSGGEQKRVAIARALAAEPKCLIFDEATNGFDLPLRKKIIEDIVDLQRKLAFTLIFITHDMELAVVIADVILVMRNSTLIEQVEFSGDISVFTSEYSKTLLYASGITDI